MQTFLPFADFKKSAKVLDMRRLGKQRSECKIILNTLNFESDGWADHPATIMWEGYELALCYYMHCIIEEWVNRGYKNTTEVPWHYVKGHSFVFPRWLGSEKLHSSHRSNLLKKDYKWYSQFYWNEPDNLQYYWP